MTAPVLVAHLTTTDVSLDWLLGPQLRAQRDAGYEVVGISAPGPHADALQASGIAHVPLRYATRSVAPLHDVRAVRELWTTLRTLRPTILHTHNPKPGVYGRIVGRLARVPIVVNTQHGLYATTDDSLVRRAGVLAVERLAAACCDRELVQNEEDLDALRRWRVPASRLTLLGNGIDLQRFDPAAVAPGRRAALRRTWGVADGEVVCGFVGRLVAEKGVVELLGAVRRLRAEGVPVRLVLVGPQDHAKADALGPAVLTAAAHEGVVVLGEREDVVDLYSAFDLLALPSHREGMPRAAMEAAAMGLPTVTSDVRGCRQVVQDGVTGIVVPVRDEVRLGTAIRTLVQDPELRVAMGTAASAAAAQRFDDDDVIATILRTYSELLGRRRSSASR